MISLNAKTIQKSFTEQAKNFETKSMNFPKQEYFPLKVYPLKTAYKQAFGASIFRCLRVNRIENYL